MRQAQMVYDYENTELQINSKSHEIKFLSDRIILDYSEVKQRYSNRNSKRQMNEIEEVNEEQPSESVAEPNERIIVDKNELIEMLPGMSAATCQVDKIDA